MADFGPNGHAICDACGLEMVTYGCAIVFVDVAGKTYNRIKHTDAAYPCHDCGAKAGQFHHWGCDMERCPKCGHQLLSCDCESVSILVLEEVKL